MQSRFESESPSEAGATALSVVVLAAGEGKRMKSARPKVLHGFAGRSMLAHVLAATEALHAQQTVVVVGHGRDQVVPQLAERAVTPVVQAEQQGTRHAARLALDVLPDAPGTTVLVVPADAPLLRADTLRRLCLARHDAAAAVLVSRLDDPTGYGRIVRDGTNVVRIVEERDATPDERTIREVGTSVYAFDGAALRAAIGRLSADNAQGEQYLTDVIELFVRDGRPVIAVDAPADETAGINDRVQLGDAARRYNERLLVEHMRNGVTVVDPSTTWVDVTVTLAADVTLLPGSELRGKTSVADGASIGPQTTLQDTEVGARSTVERAVCRESVLGADVTVGPFAYLRPGTQLADGVHIGTFVELKASDVGVGTKIPHLSYIGDASIGEQSNIGAATVFVNYDGVAKHHSTVGSHVRTGADNMFVAPVSVGDGAYTAAGSVIDQDVPPGALGIARAPQTNVANWVTRRRPGTPADEAARSAQRAQSAPNAPDEPSGAEA